jgi:hypothetical protein
VAGVFIWHDEFYFMKPAIAVNEDRLMPLVDL